MYERHIGKIKNPSVNDSTIKLQEDFSMKTIFEQQGVEYRQTGDYMFPNVELTEQTEYQIGVWGQRYKRYIKSNHRVLYYNYLTSGKLSLNATSLNSGSLSWLRNASAIDVRRISMNLSIVL